MFVTNRGMLNFTSNIFVAKSAGCVTLFKACYCKVCNCGRSPVYLKKKLNVDSINKFGPNLLMLSTFSFSFIYCKRL